MRFYEEYPHGFSGHSTGGEHVTKHYYDPQEIDGLREKYVPDSDRWDIDFVHAVMAEHMNEGELVNGYVDLAEGPVPIALVGGVLVTYRYVDEPTRQKICSLDASDIVVHHTYRGKGLGSAMLSIALQRQYQGGRMVRYPSELVIEDRNKILTTDNLEKLAELGFYRLDDKGNLRMLLAGENFTGFVTSKAELIRHKNAIAQVGWNGFLKVDIEDDGEHQQYEAHNGIVVFRSGIFVGKAKFVGGFGDDFSNNYLWNIYSGDGKLVVENVVQPRNPYFIASYLVNTLTVD